VDKLNLTAIILGSTGVLISLFNVFFRWGKAKNAQTLTIKVDGQTVTLNADSPNDAERIVRIAAERAPVEVTDQLAKVLDMDIDVDRANRSNTEADENQQQSGAAG
jgi:hypothetical protein